MFLYFHQFFHFYTQIYIINSIELHQFNWHERVQTNAIFSDKNKNNLGKEMNIKLSDKINELKKKLK